MPTFRGFVLGLRSDEVRRVTETVGLPAKFQDLSPPLSLMLGLSRQRFLGRMSTPTLRRMVWRFLLFGFWSVVAVIFVGSVAVFLLPVSLELRVALVLACVGVALGTLMATGWYWTRVVNGDRDLSDLGGWAEATPWDAALMAPEAGLLAIGIALGVIFVTFVLFAVWIPLLFIALNLVTLGEL